MKHFLVLLAAAAVMPDLNQLKQMSARHAPVSLKYDEASLSAGDRKALPKLVEAARVLNLIFMDQVWSGNRALYAKLQKDTTPLGKARLHYFWLNKGPWSDLDEHSAFVPEVPTRKPMGANFYPEDMKREEFEGWVKTLSPADKEQAIGFFTVIRRDANKKLTIVPYSDSIPARRFASGIIDFTVVFVNRFSALSSVACVIRPAATFLSIKALKFVDTVVADTWVLASIASEASA